MKFFCSTIKTNIILGFAIIIAGQSSTLSMAQDANNVIPLLPGIESTSLPQEIEPLGAVVNVESNVSVGKIPTIVDEKKEEGATPPSESSLAVPKAEDPTTTEAMNKTMESMNSTAVDENLFYDADALIPQGEFVRKGGTIKINPRTQPASKFVVVRKNSSANSLRAQLVSASRAIKLGRYDSALEIYNTLYKYNKRDPQILMGRALTLQHLGRIDEALMAYNDFLDRKPKDINARVNMLGLMVEKYPAVALRHLLDLHDENEGNIGVIAQIAVTYAQMGQSEKALKYFGVAAGMEPRNAGHLFNMAIVTDKAGDMQSAVTLYEKALEVDAVNGSGSVPRETIYERLAHLR